MSGDVSYGKSLTVPWILADYATTRKRQQENRESAPECRERGQGGSVVDEKDLKICILLDD